jgi:MFS family permease
LFFTMANTMLFALVGPIARQIGMSEIQIGVIFSASALMFLICSPKWGQLADRWGRRKVIVFGLVGSAVSALLFAAVLAAGVSSTIDAVVAFSFLLGARLLYGILCAGLQPASVAYMADITHHRSRSAGVALVGVAVGIGTILGPVLAAVMVGISLLAPLIVIAILSGATAAAVAYFLLEPKHSENNEEHVAAPIAALAPYLAITFFTYVALSSIQQTMAFYIQDILEADTRDATRLTGYCFGAFAAAALIVQIAVVRRANIAPKTLLSAGLPLLLLGLVVYVTATNLSTLLTSFAFIGAGTGLVQPGLFAGASSAVGADQQGSAAGYIQAAMAGAYIIGPIASTASYNLAIQAPAVLAGTCVALAGIGFAVIFAKNSKQDAEPNVHVAKVGEDI